MELFDYTETEIIDKENLQKAEKAVMNVTSDDEEMVGSEENQSNCSNDVYGGSGISALLNVLKCTIRQNESSAKSMNLFIKLDTCLINVD